MSSSKPPASPAPPAASPHALPAALRTTPAAALPAAPAAPLAAPQAALRIFTSSPLAADRAFMAASELARNSFAAAQTRKCPLTAAWLINDTRPQEEKKGQVNGIVAAIANPKRNDAQAYKTRMKLR
jgi:hypothetical protein